MSAVAVAAQVLLIGGLFAVYIAWPPVFVRLIAEDNWGEWATFFAFGLAACFFALRLLSSRRRLEAFWYGALALGAFVIAMEEITWGQRILDFDTPRLFEELNFQNQVTLHNIRAIAPEEGTYNVVGVGFAVWGVILPVLMALSASVRALIDRLSLPVPSLRLMPLFLASCFFFTTSSVVKSDEIGELMMALSVGGLAVERLFAAPPAFLRMGPSKPLAAGSLPLLITFTLALGVAMTAAIESVANRPHPQYVSRLNQMIPRMLSAGHLQAASSVVAYLDDHPELAEEHFLVNKARLLRATGRERDAMLVLDEALAQEEENLAMEPGDPSLMRRLAEIHLERGETDLSAVYYEKALSRYEQLLQASTLPQERVRLRQARGETLETMGDYPAALREYLRASELASTARTRDDIIWAVGRVLAACRPGDAGEQPRPKWDVIEEMARTLQGEDEDPALPCRQQVA